MIEMNFKYLQKTFIPVLRCKPINTFCFHLLIFMLFNIVVDND